MRESTGKNKLHKDALPDWAKLNEVKLRVVELNVTQDKSVEVAKATMSDENVPNKPQDVADAILNLVNKPQGKRPLRTVVDKMMGGTTEIFNVTSSKVQAGLLQNFGLSELNINNFQK